MSEGYFDRIERERAELLGKISKADEFLQKLTIDKDITAHAYYVLRSILQLAKIEKDSIGGERKT